MSKVRYHIGENGPGICTAKPGNCPFRTEEGTEAPHYFSEAEAQKAFEKIMESENGTFKTLQNEENELSKRISDPELKKALNNPELTHLISERKRLKEEIERLDKKDMTFEEVNELVKVYDEFGLVNKRLSDLKDINAEIVEKNFPEPEEHELQVPENFIKVATEESGSREWLIARQESLGGSDVGALVFAHPEYGVSNYYQTREGKLDLDPQDQEHTGAARRGDLWEPALVQMASKELGEKVYTNKSTFKEINPDGSIGYRHVNLDGFTVNEDGSIKSIVECKTSSKPEEWEDGRIPPGYVLQVQHYMDSLNVDKAHIVVNIDDTDFKIVEVTPETKIQATEAAGKRKDLQLTGEYNYNDVKDYSVNKVKEFIKEKEQRRNNTNQKRPVTKQWKESWDRARSNPAGMAFIDIETSHNSDKRGHVLEVAAYIEDPETGKLREYHRYYGVPKAHEEWNGTGRSDIHHIEPEHVKGLKPLREDKEAQEELRAFLTDKKTGRMATGIAHNANYEKKFFANAIGIDDIEWADTMNAYSSLGPEDRKNNTLESLVVDSGREYLNAHHANEDALMMYRAYKEYLEPKMNES